jgi:hypothetical protein
MTKWYPATDELRSSGWASTNETYNTEKKETND